MPDVPVSIVIPAYNEESNIAATLESLVAQKTSKKFEVILVNNASTDNTKGVAETFSDKLTIRIIDEPQKGRGIARATGFDHAQGDIIFSLDADSTAPPNWIDGLLHHFNDPKVLAVTGTGRIQDLSFARRIVFNVVQPLATFFAKFWIGGRWLAGFNFAIRKTAYEQVGGFNRALNVYEDLELGIAVEKIGKVVMAWGPQVTVSSRRFTKNGLLAGLWEYIEIYIQYKKDPVKTSLDDPR